MDRPERLGRRVAGAIGERVLEGGGRPVQNAGIMVEAGERLGSGGPTQPRLAPKQEQDGEREDREPRDPCPVRQDLPGAHPRDR